MTTTALKKRCISQLIAEPNSNSFLPNFPKMKIKEDGAMVSHYTHYLEQLRVAFPSLSNEVLEKSLAENGNDIISTMELLAKQQKSQSRDEQLNTDNWSSTFLQIAKRLNSEEEVGAFLKQSIKELAGEIVKMEEQKRDRVEAQKNILCSAFKIQVQSLAKETLTSQSLREKIELYENQLMNCEQLVKKQERDLGERLGDLQKANREAKEYREKYEQLRLMVIEHMKESDAGLHIEPTRDIF